MFELHRGYLSKCAILQYIAGARLCGSEELLQTYWFDLGQKKGIRMARSSVCRVMQGSCPFGGLSSWACFWQVLAKRQWKAMQLSAEHESQQKFWSSGCA